MEMVLIELNCSVVSMRSLILYNYLNITKGGIVLLFSPLFLKITIPHLTLFLL